MAAREEKSPSSILSFGRVSRRTRVPRRHLLPLTTLLMSQTTSVASLSRWIAYSYVDDMGWRRGSEESCFMWKLYQEPRHFIILVISALISMILTSFIFYGFVNYVRGDLAGIRIRDWREGIFVAILLDVILRYFPWYCRLWISLGH